MLFFVIVGLIYDRKLEFWIHRRDTDVERNQYHNYKLMPIQRKLWKNWLHQAKAIQAIARKMELAEAEKEVEEQIKEMKHWVRTGEVP